jgi:hypothetical protein
MRPRRCFIFRPFEGVGNAGCPLHPRPRVRFAFGKKHTSIRVHRNHPAFPHAMVLTAYVGLSPVTGLFCHRRLADIVLSKPGWADATPQNLTPASGRQDHTILPSAKSVSRQHAGNRSQVFRPALRSHRAQNAPASTAFHPASVTIMIRPSCGVGWREFVEMICPTGEAKYFCKGDWTHDSTNRPTGKSPHGAESKFRSCPGWKFVRHSPMCNCTSWARSCASPESITTTGSMDSGPPPSGASRNDAGV